MKYLFTLAITILLTACSSTPQKLTVAPELMFENLRGASTGVELVISDERENTKILGYRNAKKQGEISFTQPLSQSLGESIQTALLEQGIVMKKGPEPLTRLEVQIIDLHYHTPDETWVSHIKMGAEILVSVTRGNTNIKKRFASNRSQDVATAPTAEFNEGFMNGMLSELLNKALNDKEISNFLK